MKQLMLAGLLLFVLSGCAAGDPPASNQAVAAGAPALPLATPALIISDPTPTIGYQATAIAAQATADSANRLMVQATRENDQRVFLRESWTATMDEFARRSVAATETAYPRSYPLTATQQRAGILILATSQSIDMTAQSMTQAAPTQVIAMARARAEAAAAPLDAWVFPIGSLGIVFFVACMGVFLVRSGRPAPQRSVSPRPATAPPSIQYEKLQGTVVTVKQVTSDGFVSLTTSRLPCDKDQLTELAERVLKGESLAVNKFEGAATLWTRAIFLDMRNWLMARRYIRSTGAGMVTLMPEGEAFLHAWLEQRALPRGVELMPESPENSMSMSHKHENHGHESGGGVANPVMIVD
jgi:hypothetical protein